MAQHTCTTAHMIVLGTRGHVCNVSKLDGMKWTVVLWDVALRGSDPRQPDSTMPEESMLVYKNFSYKIPKTLTCLGQLFC